MIITSQRIVTYEQARTVRVLFTLEEAFEKRLQVYVKNGDGSYSLAIADNNLQELLSSVNIDVIVAPTYEYLCDRMRSKRLWFVDISPNEDYSEYKLHIGMFTYKTYRYKKDVMPADMIEANLIFYNYLSEHFNVPF